ncbi:calcitonin gene-related peptide type 1 receptor-like [Sphaeramia orbicularis]|uniref:calcitonin gene-related peptide type 1 receptor-like n=1 Tax=Sphaeramia orbicularis TaxID=375764 RepID=UPI00117C0358|nr:calcitonin gene-related peptide type 1 receptor-like [Sphaeramia orbicularis]XP_030014720.1 calcitonin gene-related peptide type 1 receptor-like [Sphaeramia orbicularis]XP_030014729.1 calcitonin gene-related peptide type 1 receptor-like [Sphaeramia orbicularis]
MKIRGTMELKCFLSLLVLCSLDKLLVVASPEEDYQEHLNHRGEHKSTRNQIASAQYECFQRILKQSQRKTKAIAGPVCNTTWDGWLCWDETEAGVTAEQNCPDYFEDFDPHAPASKVCSETGHWGRHPQSNRTWTNFTNCKANTTHLDEKIKMQAAMTHFYLVMIGHGLSLVSLLISLTIFFHFKSLSCQRITLHKNLFLSFVLNSIITVVWLTTVVKKGGNTYSDSVSCKLLMFIHLYLFSCNYFWMLCEGIYLHTLIVVAVFAEKQHLMWYYLLGWGFPLIPAVIHSIARLCYYNDRCWVSSDTSLLYIIHGPICAALVVNLFFLLNIVRVLITKLRVTHQAESSLYMRAVRATLILIPLLGIQFVLLPYKPHEHSVAEIYLYIMDILMHYQGLLVSTIFCFFNGEVQSVLRRHWNQQRMQFAGTFANADFFRSASYVASSLTEVHRCYSIESHTEHMNGKSYSDIFRSDSPFV